jgi:hypothetical protein
MMSARYLVTTAGESGEENDFSQWTFTYTQDYQLIKQGENELTAKISCSDNGDLNPFPTGAAAETTSSSSPLSEWHTVNVTAVPGATAAPLSSPSGSNTEEIDETSNDVEESGEESSDNTGGDVNDGDGSDDSTDDGGENSNNNFFGGDSFFD